MGAWCEETLAVHRSGEPVATKLHRIAEKARKEPDHLANLLGSIQTGHVAKDSSGEQSHADILGANREGDFSRWFMTIGHGGKS